MHVLYVLCRVCVLNINLVNSYLGGAVPRCPDLSDTLVGLPPL